MQNLPEGERGPFGVCLGQGQRNFVKNVTKDVQHGVDQSHLTSYHDVVTSERAPQP